MRNLVLVLALICSEFGFSGSAKIEKPNYHEGQLPPSLKDLKQRTDLSVRDDYPCPAAAAIAPCTCLWLLTELYLDCTSAVSNEEINQVFQQEFPVKAFYEFAITETSSIIDLDFSTNGVTFWRFNFISGPTTIETVSENVFLDSTDMVRVIMFENSQITETGFPFDALSSYSNLDFLDFYGSQLSSVPPITSDTLTQLVVGNNLITEVSPGVQDLLMNIFC